MNAFTKSISDIFKRAYAAFQMYPASIGSAFIFAIVAMIRIHLDWPEQEAYNFLFNCLHWSFAVGSIWGLTTTVAAKSRSNAVKPLYLANLITAIIVLLTFVLLYNFGMAEKPFNASRYDVLSMLAIARVSVLLLIGLLVFIELTSRPKEISGVARSLFMTQKALLIALIYGAVILAGTTGVAGAVENLLYPQMSEKVYMYISTFVGFLSFTIFVGYFPNFSKGLDDPRRETTQNQPQFIEILFGYILIPIFFAMTLVLLLWSFRTITNKTWPIFIQLSSITFTYAIGGIWLHIMITHLDSTLSNVYKRLYPIAALIILAFEARALVVQLSQFGLKTTEYYFILLWIVTAITAVLLLLVKDKAHDVLIKIICVAAIISVLPLIGYHKIPVMMQTQRLEDLLTAQGMLENEQIMPSKSDPDQTIKESITDSVVFLSSSQSDDLPVWFDRQLSDPVTFKSKMGFEQAWPTNEYNNQPGGYKGISLILEPSIVDVKEYDYMFTFDDAYLKINPSKTLTTDQGTYQLFWNINGADNMPSLKVIYNDEILVDQDMSSKIDQFMISDSTTLNPQKKTSLEDMSMVIETDQIKMFLIFKNIEIYSDSQQINYWFNLNSIYFKEK